MKEVNKALDVPSITDLHQKQNNQSGNNEHKRKQIAPLENLDTEQIHDWLKANVNINYIYYKWKHIETIDETKNEKRKLKWADQEKNDA